MPAPSATHNRGLSARITGKDINVLEDNDIRQGIKQFTNWPTSPQLYIKGEFIGGCDIIREMFQAGELQQLFADKGVTVSAPAA